MSLSRSELLFRNNFIAIELDPQDGWMYVNWRGYVSHHDVIAGCEQILLLLKQNQCTQILNDNTLVEGMWSAAAKWGGEVWFPALREAGLRQFAWVYSPSVLSRLSTDKTIKNTDTPTYIRTFDDIELAKDWLRSEL